MGQQTAECLIFGLQRLNYEVRLQLTALFPKRHRRVRKDLIYVRRIIEGEMTRQLHAEFLIPWYNRT